MWVSRLLFSVKNKPFYELFLCHYTTVGEQFLDYFLKMCLIFVGRLLSQVARKSKFLSTIHFGLTCNWKFHNIGYVISPCGLKGFFALFWCDHVLRLVFIVKLPFCTLSTFARTVWLGVAGSGLHQYIRSIWTRGLKEHGNEVKAFLKYYCNFTKPPSKS